MQQVNTFFPFGPPVYINNIDPKYVEEMLEHVDTAQMTPNKYDKRDSLAGRIDDQYTIEPLTSEACKGHILQHVSQYNFDVGGQTDTYEISGLWVNIQRYMELNPMHSHDGMFSFVIFLKKNLKFSKLPPKKYYTGFWLRFGSGVCDFIILFIIGFISGYFIQLIFYDTVFGKSFETVLGIAISWSYICLFQSSKYQIKERS